MSGRFDVWAPHADGVTLHVDDQLLPMRRTTNGWWTVDGPEPTGEVDYGYVINPLTADTSGGDSGQAGETVVPDPRSRRLPLGVHGRSRTFDASAFGWSDATWTGRRLAGSVVYEMHVGTFTPEGTLDAAIGKLEHLRSFGVDFIELMPVNAFNGEHGWGYDGVAWFAVHEPYGGPAAYQRFVDACHVAGIGVIQDVVYNHLGPSGNYLPAFGPYLADGENTWGANVNLDGEGSDEVRTYILDNVAMWFADYHVDGLRLDAVHALADDSATHLLEEMALLTERLSAHLDRPLTLIAESDMNDTRLVTPREGGGLGLHAQWSDDFHHAVHVALTGETDGYYADFAPLSALAKVCEQGFFHDGTWSSFRDRVHGHPVDLRMPGWRLVVCNQNHDQVGNRARGDRLSDPSPGHLDDDQVVCAALLTLTAPFTPMLFQGEEWAASTPFTFFTSHPEEHLAVAVTEGRVNEFEQMAWDVDAVPDPQDPKTFESSKLDWSELAEGRHAVVLDAYRSLAQLRREHADLTDPDLTRTNCQYDENARWFVMRRGDVVVAVNFGEDEVTVDLNGSYELVWSAPSGASTSTRGVVLPPHAGAVLVP